MFCNGLGCTMMLWATGGSIVGFMLAAKLPPLLAAVVLFLTPLSFVMSLARNSRELIRMPARCAASWLISKRTLVPSRTKLTMPPCSRKPPVSPTVSTGKSRTSRRIAGRRLLS